MRLPRISRAARRIILFGTFALFTVTVLTHNRPKSTVYSKDPVSTATSWNQKNAAAYLDQRQAWWMEWPKAARDHDTFCISCHTAVPYALSRPALRDALGEAGPSPNEARLIENVRKRVRLWKEVEPFYSDADRGAYKTVESRGTESVLNALLLASYDARNGQLSDDTRAAFDDMWAEQQTSDKQKGAWLWLRFANEPWEADDSDYYGAALAAIAVGSAPGNYVSGPAIQNRLDILRQYLNRERATQPLFNEVVLLWAAAKVPGILQGSEQQAIVSEILGKQQSDGGWSLSSLAGSWKRHDGTPQETRSDGYATGLITFALQQSGFSRENAHYQRAVAWLQSNQSKMEGSWPSYSLNKNEKNHLSRETALFMNDAATAYAVMALSDTRR
jgi:squalene-hopene/tetraprenyl-beta-curcumene cyclase